MNNKILNEKKKDKEDYTRKTNKSNFNYSKLYSIKLFNNIILLINKSVKYFVKLYLFYNKTFNNENTYKNANEFNVFPTSVEKALYNNQNKSLNPFNSIINNNIKTSQDKYYYSLFSNPNNKQNNNDNNSDSSMKNNNSDDSLDEQMKPQNSIKNNFFIDFNLKAKK